jgi:peroxiredoxin
VVVTLAVAAAALLRGPSARVPDGGQPIPDPTLSGILDGTPHRISERRGQPVLLFVFETGTQRGWEAIEIVERLHRRFYRRGLATIGVVIDRDVEAARAYVRRNPFTFLVLTDPGGREVQAIAGALDEPKLVLIDREGRLQERLPAPRMSEVGILRARLDRELPKSEAGW